jgi:hypothetical protein
MVKGLRKQLRVSSREKCECGKPADFWVKGYLVRYSYNPKTGVCRNPQVIDKQDEWRPEEYFYCAECYAYWLHYTNDFCVTDIEEVKDEIKEIARELRQEK